MIFLYNESNPIVPYDPYEIIDEREREEGGGGIKSSAAW